MWQSKFIMILVFSFLSVSAGAKKRKVANVEQDLAPYAGTYQLVKGRSANCPDGVFGVSEDAFTVGASFRISGINQPYRTSLMDRVGDCTTRTQSSFDGRKLKHTLVEKCPGQAESIKEHVFEFNKTNSTHYIKLMFNMKTKSGDSYESTLKFECLYSREVGGEV